MADNFAALYGNDNLRELFVRGMSARTRPVGRALATAFPWSNYSTLIDIGAAQGALPVEIAHVHPKITGGGFDLPPLAPLFEQYVQENGLLDRLRFYPGDFLKEPLPPADVLVFGRVLHNWNLPTKLMLVRKAYDALPRSGALIVYETFIDDDRQRNVAGLLSSLNMLLMSDGGFNCTAADCANWVRKTGFCDIGIEPLTADQSMVVGIK